MQQHLPKLTNLCQHHHSEQQYRCKVGQIVVVVHGIGEKFAQRSRGPSWLEGKDSLSSSVLVQIWKPWPIEFEEIWIKIGDNRYGPVKCCSTPVFGWLNPRLVGQIYILAAYGSNPHLCRLKHHFWSKIWTACVWTSKFWWLHVVLFWSLTPGPLLINWLINLSSSLFIHVCWLTCPNSFCLHPFSNMNKIDKLP